MSTQAKAAKHASLDVAGSVYLITSDGKTLSLPIPSISSRDPLNWSQTKRAGALFCQAFSTSTSLVVAQLPALVVGALSKEFPGQLFRVGSPVPFTFLFMGIGCYIWTPLSLAIGRRSVLLLANILLLGSVIWASFAGDFVQTMIAFCLNGLSAGTAGGSGLVVVIDLTFIHQRPQALAMIWALTGAMNYLLLALVTRAARSATDWRFAFKTCIAPVAISCIIVFLFFPETFFRRPAVAFDGRVLLQGASEKIQIYPDWSTIEKDLPEPPQSNRAIKLRELRFCGVDILRWDSMYICYRQIILCLLNPLVLWILALNILSLTAVMITSTTYPMVLSSAPYNMPIHHITLINLAAGIGDILAWPISGYLSSSIVRRLTLRNGGVRDAEFYLPAFVLPVLATTAGLLVYGFAAERKLHFMLIYISYGLNGFGFVGTGTTSIIWVTEAFPRHAAAAITVVMGVYLPIFGLSYAFEPWISSQGFAKVHMTLAGATLFVGCIGIPVAFWGKRIRQSLEGKWSQDDSGALRPQGGRYQV